MEEACIHRTCFMYPPLCLMRKCRKSIPLAVIQRMVSGVTVLRESMMRWQKYSALWIFSAYTKVLQGR